MGSRRTRSALALAAALTALAAMPCACRDVLGVEGYGTTPPISYGSCLRVGYSSQSCRDCVETACCREAQTCSRETTCPDLAACLAACSSTDVACRVKCNTSIRRTSAMSALMACAARSCGDCAAAHATYGGVLCTGCIESDAPDDLEAFSRSSAALDLDACRKDCPPNNEDQCTCSDYSEGREVLSALTTGTCSGACQKEQDWSCLGKVEWPRPGLNAPALDLYVGVSQLGSESSRLGGAEIRACVVGSSCDDKVSAFALDPTKGYAELPLDARKDGPYFSSLRVDWTAPSETMNSTAMLFFFPPVVRSPAWTWRRLVSHHQGDVFAATLNDTLDWDKQGGIIFSVATCNGVPASGVIATLSSVGDPPEKVLYLTDQVLLSDDQTETTAAGLGAVLKVAPVTHTMTLKLADGRTIGTYEFGVTAGATTTLSLSPGPSGKP